MPKKRKNSPNLFDSISLERILNTYNPWWSQASYTPTNPLFKRDFFAAALRHIEATHDLALLINGPRRVGKTTLMRQLIEHLIKNKKVSPSKIFFFSLDDPFIQQLPMADQGGAFERMLQSWETSLGCVFSNSQDTVYCFLDEVQRLPNWELYVKRHIDLKHPIRFIISGSASHTIFRKSLESLLGRMVEISLPPFTFREWVRFNFKEYEKMSLGLSEIRIDITDRSLFCQNVQAITRDMGKEKIIQFNSLVDNYAVSGGFPQLWQIKDPVERAQFIDLQFVQRVTLEDLRLIKEIRRPEIFHQFLRYAFARTGEEYNLENLAGKIKTTRATLTTAMPLLLQTELIRKVERFTNKPVRLRTTHAKLYAADTTLYESITKEPAHLNSPDGGKIAETLVFNVMRRFAGLTDITYFRTPDSKREVDFILRIGRNMIPVEVKHTQRVDDRWNESVNYFIDQFGPPGGFGIIVNNGLPDLQGHILEVPIGIFLLLA